MTVDFAFPTTTLLRIEATVRVTARTGVEMEALTAVSVAALTIYDMCKSVDRGMEITDIRLEEKSGGRSGHYVRLSSRPLRRDAAANSAGGGPAMPSVAGSRQRQEAFEKRALLVW